MNANLEFIDFGEPVEPGMDMAQEIVQGTVEWKQERAGYISASRISEMLAKGNGVSRKKYLYELSIERLTGKPRPEGFKSKRMEQGNVMEPKARELYEFYYDDVRQVGFIKHPTIEWFGASPDGLISENGGLELKNRDLAIHLDLLFSRKPPRDAMLQMYAQMSCCNLDWVDYCSYNDEGLPPHLQLIVIRIERNQGEIDVIEKAVKQFNGEINSMVERLRHK